jgi:dTDP-4-amino-4,6-dideoxygalactose transaminase
MRILRVHGGHPKYYHALIGGNFRLDALQAAVLAVKFQYLDEWTAARQRNAAFYDRALADYPVGTPVVSGGYRHIYNQYVIRADERDALRHHLAERGVGTEIYYPVPLHMQQCFEYLGYRPEDCPESKRAGETTLALPVYPELDEAQLQQVVGAIGEVVTR